MTTKTPIINFTDAKQKLVEKAADANDDMVMDEVTNQELIQEGLEAFMANLPEDANGFLTIIFDKENNPTIVSAGDLNVFTTIGVLEFCKNEFAAGMIYGAHDVELVEPEEEF